jgi:hypothetical protein
MIVLREKKPDVTFGKVTALCQTSGQPIGYYRHRAAVVVPCGGFNTVERRQ